MTKRKVAVVAAAVVGALGLTVMTAGSAFAWHDDVSVDVADCVVTISATDLMSQGQESDHVTWKIYAGDVNQDAIYGDPMQPKRRDAAVATGMLLPDPNDKNVAVPVTLDGDDALAPGTYELLWWLHITADGEPEPGPGDKTKTFTVPNTCEEEPPPPGSAAPGAAAEADCDNDGIKVTLDNSKGTADAEFTVTVGDEVKMQTVAAGETGEVSFGPLEDGTHAVVVTEATTRFEEPFDVTVECVDDEPSQEPSAEPTPTPTPTPTVQGSTLPQTGAGFPTGAAAAFALLLVSVGGFLLSYRKGLLPLPFMHRH